MLAKLGYLASRKLQDRFALNGTRNNYIVLDQVVEDAYSFVRMPRSGVDVTGLRSALESLDIDEAMSNDEIVNANESWARLRMEALRILDQAGVDLDAFEKEELETD